MTRVSVIVPVHNDAPSIERCAQALWRQTCLADVEFVFVDDGSTDESWPVLQRVADGAPVRKGQIRLLRFPENRGADVARLSAAEASSGDFLAFCDADDELPPEYLETLCSVAERTGADVVCCPVDEMLPDGRILRHDSVSDAADPDALIDAEFHSVHFNSLCNKLFQRRLFLERPVITPSRRCRVFEDLFMVAQLLPRCRKLALTSKTGYRYRRRTESMSGTWRPGYMDDVLLIATELEKVMPARHQAAIDHFRHLALRLMVKYRYGTHAEFRRLWPKLHTWRSLCRDRRLNWGIRMAVFLATYAFTPVSFLDGWAFRFRSGGKHP